MLFVFLMLDNGGGTFYTLYERQRGRMQKNLLLSLFLFAVLAGAMTLFFRHDDDAPEGLNALMEKGFSSYAAKKYDTAFAAFEKAAATGTPEAIFVLGNMYMNGFGVEKDQDKAISLYILAAQKNDASAQYTLALLYMSGQIVPRNRAFAEKNLLAAAQNDNAEAMATLGAWYERGLMSGGVDMGKAFFWYKKAAQAGDVSAQTALSLLYTRYKDYQQASHWNNALKKRQRYIDRFSGHREQRGKEFLYTLPDPKR